MNEVSIHIVVLLFLLSVNYISNIQTAEVVIEWEDEVGDERGEYPTNAVFAPFRSIFDIREFKVEVEEGGDNSLYTFTFQSEITNPENATFGFTHQLIHAYIQTSPFPTSPRVKSFFPTSNHPYSNPSISFDPSFHWSFLLTVSGWGAKLILPNGEEMINIIHPVLQNKSSICVSMPNLFGKPQSFWSYVVLISAFDFNNSSQGEGMMRRHNEKESEWEFGGGVDGKGDPNIIDFLSLPNNSQTEIEIYYHYCISTQTYAIIPPISLVSLPYYPTSKPPSLTYLSMIDIQRGNQCYNSTWNTLPITRYQTSPPPSPSSSSSPSPSPSSSSTSNSLISEIYLSLNVEEEEDQHLDRYGNDIQYLKVEIDYTSDYYFHFTIDDAITPRIRSPLIPPSPSSSKSSKSSSSSSPPPSTSPSSSSLYDWSVSSSPFGIEIKRKNTSDVIFRSFSSPSPQNDNSGDNNDDNKLSSSSSSTTSRMRSSGSSGSSGSSTIYRDLVYKEYYIEISSILNPRSDLYGLGERTGQLLLSRDDITYSIFNTDQHSTLPNRNLYGSHPFYLSVEEDGTSYGVLMNNHMGMDILLSEEKITYKMIGGIIDIYIFLGPTPSDVIQQYHSLLGIGDVPPYWILGYHQSRRGYKSVYQLQSVIDHFQSNLLPLDSIWSDVDYMEEEKIFTLDNLNYPEDKISYFISHLHQLGLHYGMTMLPSVEINPSYDVYVSAYNSSLFILSPSSNSSSSSAVIGKAYGKEVNYLDFHHPSISEFWKSQISNFRDRGVHFDALYLDKNEVSSGCDGHCSLHYDNNDDNNNGDDSNIASYLYPHYQSGSDDHHHLYPTTIGYGDGSGSGSGYGGSGYGSGGYGDRGDEEDECECSSMSFIGGSSISPSSSSSSVSSSIIYQYSRYDFPPYMIGGYGLDRASISMSSLHTTYKDYPLSPSSPPTSPTSPSTSEIEWIEEYYLHNMYGYQQARITTSALHDIDSTRRWVVLSRSLYLNAASSSSSSSIDNNSSDVGSGGGGNGGDDGSDGDNNDNSKRGRIIGHILGENESSWEEMKRSIASTITMNMFGIPLVGANICGQKGNVSAELCGRWMQLGALLYPFARNHNDKDQRDQEPYSLGEEVLEISQIALYLRYSLLPYYYSLFYDLQIKGGGLIIKPLWWIDTTDKTLRSIDHEFMIGSSLLVIPILNSSSLYDYQITFPSGFWFDYLSAQLLSSSLYSSTSISANSLIAILDASSPSSSSSSSSSSSYSILDWIAPTWGLTSILSSSPPTSTTTSNIGSSSSARWAAPMVFIRGHSIIPLQPFSPQPSSSSSSSSSPLILNSKESKKGGINLIIALSPSNSSLHQPDVEYYEYYENYGSKLQLFNSKYLTAEGELYLDDGISTSTPYSHWSISAIFYWKYNYGIVDISHSHFKYHDYGDINNGGNVGWQNITIYGVLSFTNLVLLNQSIPISTFHYDQSHHVLHIYNLNQSLQNPISIYWGYRPAPQTPFQSFLIILSGIFISVAILMCFTIFYYLIMNKVERFFVKRRFGHLHDHQYFNSAYSENENDQSIVDEDGNLIPTVRIEDNPLTDLETAFELQQFSFSSPETSDNLPSTSQEEDEIGF